MHVWYKISTNEMFIAAAKLTGNKLCTNSPGVFFIRSRIPESNHITSDCSRSRRSKRPLTVLTACKFMSLLKKTLNECHAFFYPRCDCRLQQLIRHVKELVQLIVAVVVVRGLWTVLGIKMVTPEPGEQGEQQTHLKMLKLINCAANSDQDEASSRQSRGQRWVG